MRNEAKDDGLDGNPAKALMNKLLDEIDEERARRLRQELGQRRCLVSWSKDERGTWLARLSGPGHAETIEQAGHSRIDAIEGAAGVLREVLTRSK